MSASTLQKTGCLLVTTIMLLFSSLSQADIVLSSTRVIYKEKSKDVMVQLENKGAKPLLVQTWLDTGKDNIDPSKLQVPFSVTPPVFRMEPKRGQTLRVMFTGSSPLPKDKESVFWLNVLEIPPKPSAEKLATQNLLQFAFKTRIKLFYRPEGLLGSSAEAAKNLKWQLVTKDEHLQLKANNSSAYHVSFSNIALMVNGKKYPVNQVMVAPGSDTTMAINGLTTNVSGAKLEYSYINDFGGKDKIVVNL
ncbi:MAG TPA: fimbrial chaperone [Scandinavium sp.]|jgi:chaperone protein EcpD